MKQHNSLSDSVEYTTITKKDIVKKEKEQSRGFYQLDAYDDIHIPETLDKWPVKVENLQVDYKLTGTALL